MYEKYIDRSEFSFLTSFTQQNLRFNVIIEHCIEILQIRRLNSFI